MAVSLLGLSACSSSSAVSSPSDIFTVDGAGYPVSKFDAIVTDLITAGQIKSTDGRLSTEDARSVIRTLIQFESFGGFAEDNDVSITDAERAQVESEAKADPQFETFSKDLQDLLLELNAASVMLSKVKTPSESELRARYDASPASTGVLCLSHILVKTEAEARSVLADLDKGADFAAEAKAKSIEPAAKTSGGQLGSGDEPCAALGELQSTFDKDFLVGAVAAKAGVPSGPVKSSFGYHVILNRPFDEVKDSVARTITKSPGNTLFVGYLTGAKISVNSKYGRWNPALATIE